jgi:putative ABC transport system substrate-binding protein
VTPERRAAVALIALGACGVALSQPARTTHRVGFLVPRSSTNFNDRLEAFRGGMRALGYAEGKNLTIEWRFADGDYGRLPALANELIASRVDVLVVDSTPGVKVARAATSTIPIVMISVGDPVASGFVASLPRPGGNITGLSNVVADISAKYVELLREAIPGLTRIAVLSNPDNATHAGIATKVQAAGRTMGVRTSTIAARNPEDIEAAFATLRKDSAGALIVLGDPFYGQQARQLAALALKDRVPTLTTNRALAEAGALMSYGQDLVEHYRRAATYVDALLKGAKPSDLPVQQSRTIELVVNLKTAKALGLAIPPPLLLRADDVIQ